MAPKASSMTVATLRKELDARGIDSKGLKPALVAALQPMLDAEESGGGGGGGGEGSGGADAPAAAAAAPEPAPKAPEPVKEAPAAAPVAAAPAPTPAPAAAAAGLPDIEEIKRRAGAIAAKAMSDLADTSAAAAASAG
eukprot:CAMPEP_0197586844 /NCGR_PEP_ID=MMETSP1326-20131121/8679_1 /TAXON_ID=1155430 /ORGANISM="Genus nov. species nov., Strain RCC2288" /LENGTH=137 /DNA_ID=CAMNT_0043151507 /DNA_START=76 /DNA_END=485 /DNA_ORIENTATION=-